MRPVSLMPLLWICLIKGDLHMITIQQTGCSMTGLGDLVSRYSRAKLSMNEVAIRDDIEKLRDKLKTNGIAKQHHKNIQQIIKYLERLIMEIDDEGNLELTWKYTKGKLSCSPISLANCQPYNIRATDYINTGDETLTLIDYKDVYEIIAFEMMHRDLGETHESMEEHLKDIGVLSISPANKITDLFDGESPVSMSRYMRIGSSPYATDNGKLSWDYFYSAGGEQTAFKSHTYKECTDRTFDIITLILTKSILSNLFKCGVTAEVCAVDTDGMFILTDKDISSSLGKYLDTVVVRVFGRKFEVCPKIRTF